MSIMETLATPALSDPLVPPEADLRDFPFMPLDVATLCDSGIAVEATGDEFRAAVLLWCKAWHQVPAGSLPNNNALLAQYAGYGRVVGEWLKVRDGALRGFVLCTDGRLYHPTVAAKACEAWEKKQAYERSKAAERERKKGKKGASPGIPPETDAVPPEVPQPSAGIPPEPPQPSAGKTAEFRQRHHGIPAENALKGEGQGEGDSTPPLHFVSGGGSATDPVATTTDPENLVEAFDAALVEVWGEKAARRAPHSTDFDVAQDLAEAGVTADLMAAVCLRQLGQMRSRPKAKPPWSLSVVAADVRAALAAAQAAPQPPVQFSTPKAPAPYRGILTDDDFSRWIAPCDVAIAGNEAVITAPSPVAAKWIRERLEVGLMRALVVQSIRIKVDPAVVANPIPHHVPERA